MREIVKKTEEEVRKMLLDERAEILSKKSNRAMFINTPLQKFYVRLLGMPRSGTHAVMNWLVPKLGKTACYVDEKQKCEFFIPPQESQRLPAFKTSGVVSKNSADHKDVLVHGFEWRPCNSVFNPNMTSEMRSGVGGWDRKLNVLILRDPYNLAASMRIKRTDNSWRPLRGTGMAQSFVRHWTDHAVWFLEHENDPDCLCVNYNKWFLSIEYRKSICAKIGVAFSDSGLNDVSDYAAGSSFDGLSKNGKGQEMNVTERWPALLSDPLYLWMFAKWPEISSMSRIIFGELPAEKAILSAPNPV